MSRFHRTLILCVIASFALAASAAAPNVASLAEAYASPRVEAGVKVSNYRVAHGSVEIVLKDGTVSRIKSGDEVLGLYLAGTGVYTYKTTDPHEMVVAAGNAKRATNLKVNKSDTELAFDDRFETAVVWAAGVALPPAGTPAADGANLQEGFDKHLKFMQNEQFSAPVVQQLIQQKLNAPARAYVRAEFVGGANDAVYVYDDVDDRSEFLFTLSRVGGTDGDIKNLRVPVPVAQHPLGRTIRKMPPPKFLLTELDYELVAEDKTAKLTVTETIKGMAAPISVLRFNLWQRIFATSDDIRYAKLESVKDESGRALSFDHRQGQLIVGLPQPLEPNAKIKLKFEISGDFIIRPGKDSYWQLGAGDGWYPDPERVESDFTVHSVIKVRKPFVPFAPGETLRRVEEGGYNVIENVVDKPVGYTVAHAGKYAYEEEKRGDLTIRVATYAGANAKAMKQLASLAFDMIDYYTWFLGEFPFTEFNIIEMNDWGYGQAPPATMFITQEAFKPLLGETNRFFSQGINERFAHEIAHQYWGHVVSWPTPEEQWISESFAEYSAALLLQKNKGQKVYDKLIRHWQANAKDATGIASIATANRIRIPADSYAQFIARFGLVYDKGSLLLASLHKELGDQQFYTFLKSYQKSFKWKFGTTEDVAGLLQYMTKKDYTPFFESYYWGTEMPPLK